MFDKFLFNLVDLGSRGHGIDKMGWRLEDDARIVAGIVGKELFPDSPFADVDERPIPQQAIHPV